MAKLKAHGTELYRYFSTKHRGLVSVRSDGTRLIKRVEEDWKILSRKQADVSMDVWRAAIEKLMNSLAAWKKRVRSLPTQAQLEYWTFDGLCETTDGDLLEPDFRGDWNHGPSWLVALRLV
jgi:hypothetical protein